jgi:glycosyltransferase involved in cell wall biosynthesis
VRITWSLPVPGESPESSRGDVVRARSLVEGLQGEGHDVRLVAASSHGEAGAAVAAYRGSARRILPGALARPLRDAGRLALARAHARRLARAAGEWSADVIVETQVHLIPSGRLAAARTGAPLILDDCSPPAEERVLGPGLPSWVVERSFRAQAAAARALIVSSYSLAEALGEIREAAGKIQVVPNGVDARVFARGNGTTLRRELGLERAVVVGFLGSFQPWHRLDLLLEAMAAVPDEPRLSLLLVGDGPEREAVLAQAARLGVADRVRAAGAVPAGEVPRMLSACDIGVLPGSNSYGQPMKLVEYAAAGIPSVAPNLPPVHEVLRVDVTGLTFPPGDAGGLASALVRLAADPALRRRVGDAARASAQEWSWEARARALARVLQNAHREEAP